MFVMSEINTKKPVKLAIILYIFWSIGFVVLCTKSVYAISSFYNVAPIQLVDVNMNSSTAATPTTTESWINATPDGRYVVFASDASDLVPNDTNGVSDVFVKDMTTNTIQRISVSTGGAQGNNTSIYPFISANGRYVVFESDATNLISGDSNGTTDVYMRDLQTNTTSRISVSNSGSQGDNTSSFPTISADGRYILFVSAATNLVLGDTNSAGDVFVRDTQSNTTIRVSVSNSGLEADNGVVQGYSAVLSRDGRHVVFASGSTNLVNGDTNGTDDIFVRNLDTNTTAMVSVGLAGSASNGSSGPILGISADGRYVTFASDATNLATNDNNGSQDIFIRDTTNNTTRIVNHTPGMQSSNQGASYSAISGNGNFVTFLSTSTDLLTNDSSNGNDPQTYIYNVADESLQLVSRSDNSSFIPKYFINVFISDDGTRLAGMTDAALVPDDNNSGVNYYIFDLVKSSSPQPLTQPVSATTNLQASKLAETGQSNPGLILLSFVFLSLGILINVKYFLKNY